MSEAYAFLLIVADLLHTRMPDLPIRLRYPPGAVDGDEATSVLLARRDGRRFRVTVRELAPRVPADA